MDGRLWLKTGKKLSFPYEITVENPPVFLVCNTSFTVKGNSKPSSLNIKKKGNSSPLGKGKEFVFYYIFNLENQD